MKKLPPLSFAFLVACGGSVTSVGDGGSDASMSNDAPVGMDGPSSNDATSDSSPSPYDGTVGKACTSNADCLSPNGPEVVKCSNSVFAPEDYYPTAVCIIDTCSPVSDMSSLHFCDGPDNASSPGICVAGFSGSICLPKCSYDQSGTRRRVVWARTHASRTRPHRRPAPAIAGQAARKTRTARTTRSASSTKASAWRV